MSTEEKNINHRKLLKKYMALVDGEESVTFLHCISDNHRSGVKFTEEEVKELRRIEQEIEE